MDGQRLYRVGLKVLGGVLVPAVARVRVSGLEHLPSDGPALVVCNHISVFDPPVLAVAVGRSGRLARFLVKAELFTAPLLGRALQATGHIPVVRGTAAAHDAFSAAADALRAGEVVAMYPEGRISQAPGQWPVSAKSGAARLALELGVPVIPAAQWGATQVIPPGGGSPGVVRSLLRSVVRRPQVRLVLGEPVDLSAFAGHEVSVDAAHAATDVVMRAVTALLGELRPGETPVLAGA